MEGRLPQGSQSKMNRQVPTSPAGGQGLSSGFQEVLAPALQKWLLRTLEEEKVVSVWPRIPRNCQFGQVLGV